ncbi:hypothetical protein [Pseudomonas putida]|uniref:hypothetical protein n=1 Tax=Pseudomonas putida TaxID=303 RepID=UPI000A10E42F|nr:hypothetical protein [Pseudomonas putida]MDP9523708.1 hypothetical protein [Pseudomonas putida]ORL52830.1 hypothetical protein B7H18_04980 [Pseudomonas putida]
MPDSFNLEGRFEPVTQVLDHQTDYQLRKNFAQTFYNVYELTDDQAQEVNRVGLGFGNFFDGSFIEGRTVTINGEVVLSLKMRGSNVYLRMPCTDI